jgi:hypothetical protein
MLETLARQIGLASPLRELREQWDSTRTHTARKITDAMGRVEPKTLLLFATAAFAACSRSGLPLEEVAGQGALTDAGRDSTLADAAIVDSGTTPDAPAEGGLALTFFGTVSVGAGGPTAVFVPWDQPVPGPGLGPCSGVEAGACCYVTANKTNGGAGGGGPARLSPRGPIEASAGPIVFRNGPDTFTLLPPYYERQKTVPSDIDDTVYVAATGDVVHSFQGSIVVPGYVEKVVLPVGLVAPLAADLTVSWAPDGPPAERMWLSVGVWRVLHFDAGPWADAGFDEFVAEIDCDVLDSTGGLVVPASLLGMLQAGDSASVFTLTRYVVNLVSADNAHVVLQASTNFTPGAPLVFQ